MDLYGDGRDGLVGWWVAVLWKWLVVFAIAVAVAADDVAVVAIALAVAVVVAVVAVVAAFAAAAAAAAAQEPIERAQCKTSSCQCPRTPSRAQPGISHA